MAISPPILWPKTSHIFGAGSEGALCVNIGETAVGNELRVQTGGERCSDLGVTEEQKLPPDEVGVTGATDDEVQVSDPEVIAKPVTRRFTLEYPVVV